MHTTITSFHFPWSLAWWNSGRLRLLPHFSEGIVLNQCLLARW